MKLGAEPKKIALFAGLVVVAGIIFWMNSSSDTSSVSTARKTANDPTAALAVPGTPVVEGADKVTKRRAATTRATIVEWLPKQPATVDPSKVDPTLRMDLLAKVQ